MVGAPLVRHPIHPYIYVVVGSDSALATTPQTISSIGAALAA